VLLCAVAQASLKVGGHKVIHSPRYEIIYRTQISESRGRIGNQREMRVRIGCLPHYVGLSSDMRRQATVSEPL